MHFIFQIDIFIYKVASFFFLYRHWKGEKNKLEFIYGIDLSANGKYSKCVDNVHMCFYCWEMNTAFYSLLLDQNIEKLGHMMWMKWRYDVMNVREDEKGKMNDKQAGKLYQQQVHVKRDKLLRISHYLYSIYFAAQFLIHECQFTVIVNLSDHIQLNAVLFSSLPYNVFIVCRCIHFLFLFFSL